MDPQLRVMSWISRHSYRTIYVLQCALLYITVIVYNRLYLNGIYVCVSHYLYCKFYLFDICTA